MPDLIVTLPTSAGPIEVVLGDGAASAAASAAAALAQADYIRTRRDIEPLGTVANGALLLDLADAGGFSVTLAGNINLAEPLNMPIGESALLYVTQDATGSRTITFDPAFVLDTGAGLSTAPGAIDEVLLDRFPDGSIVVSIHNPISRASGITTTGLQPFTPVVTCGSPGDAVFTLTKALGRYVKTGGELSWWIEVEGSMNAYTTATGQVQIAGLPFPNAGGLAVAASVGEASVTGPWPNASTQINAKVLAGEQVVKLYGMKSAAFQTAYNIVTIGPNGAFRFTLSGRYPVA